MLGGFGLGIAYHYYILIGCWIFFHIVAFKWTTLGVYSEMSPKVVCGCLNFRRHVRSRAKLKCIYRIKTALFFF
jgi:hypothetical protein